MSENAPRILKHTDDRHVQTRLDYMLIYKSESKAKIVRILETWMDTKYAEAYKGTADSKEQKSEPPAEDLWITMSYDQFSLFVYGTIQHDTIKQQVDELVASKHVERRIHPVYPYGPPQYRLNRELVQKSLNELEIPGNLFDLLPMFVTPRKKRTPQEKYPQGGGKKPTRDPGKIPPPTGETSHPSNNHTKNTKNPTKNEGTYSERDHDDTGATAPTPALSQDDPIAMDTRTNEHEENEHDDLAMAHDSLDGRQHAHDGTADNRQPLPVQGIHQSGSNRSLPHGDAQRSQQSHGRDERADQRFAPEATRTGAGQQKAPPPVADSNGYENDEEDTVKTPVVRVSAQQLSTSIPQSGKVSHARTEGRKKKAEAPEPITLSHDAEKIWRAWCSLFTVEVELIPSNAKAAEKLVKPARVWCSKLHWTLAEWLKSVKDNAYAADTKGYYSKRGVKLFDIPRELEGWQSAKEHELATLAQAANPKPTEPKPIDPTLEMMRQQRARYAQGVMQ